MSETSPLKDLGAFAPVSPVASNDAKVRDEALASLARSFAPARPIHQRVSDILGILRAVSNRTRRQVMPRVALDIDVFAPGGQRALRVFTNHELMGPGARD